MKQLYIAAAIVILTLAGLALALVPPLPANQVVGIYDTGISSFSEPLCRNCHNSMFLGGDLVPGGEYGCTNCHPVVTVRTDRVF